MQFPLFEALARGYMTSAGGFLTAAEKQSLAVAGKLITFEIGIRFLTDYLSGDTYFKVHRQGHNLDRARSPVQAPRIDRTAGEADQRSARVDRLTFIRSPSYVEPDQFACAVDTHAA